MTQSRKERNQLIIQEFRAHGGSAAEFAGTRLLLLTTIGARSGQPHVTPLAYLADGDRLLIFAANGGRPRHPAWYHNLVAHPDVTVEVGTERFAARALVLTGEERDRLYARQARVDRRFAEFEANTVRTIPVIALLPTEKGSRGGMRIMIGLSMRNRRKSTTDERTVDDMVGCTSDTFGSWHLNHTDKGGNQ